MPLRPILRHISVWNWKNDGRRQYRSCHLVSSLSKNSLVEPRHYLRKQEFTGTDRGDGSLLCMVLNLKTRG